MDRDPQGRVYIQDEDERTAADDGIDELIDRYGANHPDERSDNEVAYSDELKTLLSASVFLEGEEEEVVYPIVIDEKLSAKVIEGLRLVASEQRSDFYSPDSPDNARKMLGDIGESVPNLTQ